jgi:Ulp1 family protease
MARSHTHNQFLGNTKIGQNIFALKKLLIPVNIQNVHWILIQIDFQLKSVLVHDTVTFSRTLHENYIELIRSYLIDEYKALNQGEILNMDEWRCCTDNNTPGQFDTSNDCCIFLCFFMDFLMLDWPIYPLTQECLVNHGRTWLFITMVWKRFYHESFLYTS